MHREVDSSIDRINIGNSIFRFVQLIGIDVGCLTGSLNLTKQARRHAPIFFYSKRNSLSFIRARPRQQSNRAHQSFDNLLNQFGTLHGEFTPYGLINPGGSEV